VEDIVRFLPVQFPEQGVGGIVEKLQFTALIKLRQATARCIEVCARELWQLRNEFSRTHEKKLTLAGETDKQVLMVGAAGGVRQNSEND
jgi:hypothetical protein